MGSAAVGVLKKDSSLFGFLFTIYAYRDYLYESVARDLRKRYKRSLLGYFWSMLNPLLMMTILAVVFSNLMGHKVESYAVFLFSGMLPYRFFSSTVAESLSSISNNIKLMSQVPVPKYIFPLSVAVSNLVDFMLTIVPLLLVMLVLGRPFHLSILALPFILLPLFMFSMGIALLFTVSNVFFQDTQHLSSVILQALYYLCPILYGREHLPEWLVGWLTINPMFTLIEAMRGIFYYGQIPSLVEYSWLFLGGAISLTIGLWVFNKTEDKFIYFV